MWFKTFTLLLKPILKRIVTSLTPLKTCFGTLQKYCYKIAINIDPIKKILVRTNKYCFYYSTCYWVSTDHHSSSPSHRELTHRKTMAVGSFVSETNDQGTMPRMGEIRTTHGTCVEHVSPLRLTVCTIRSISWTTSKNRSGFLGRGRPHWGHFPTHVRRWHIGYENNGSSLHRTNRKRPQGSGGEIGRAETERNKEDIWRRRPGVFLHPSLREGGQCHGKKGQTSSAIQRTGHHRPEIVWHHVSTRARRKTLLQVFLGAKTIPIHQRSRRPTHG